jgi:hypothetical protein
MKELAGKVVANETKVNLKFSVVSDDYGWLLFQLSEIPRLYGRGSGLQAAPTAHDQCRSDLPVAK